MRTSSTDRAVRVGLVQINNSFSNQNYLPYAVGLLQAYAQHHAPRPQRYEFLLPIYARIPVRQAVEQLLPADVVGFSAYVWNIRLSLEIARRLKQAKPEILIVFGGPQVPDRAEAFLRQNPFIDLACHGEGEQVFLAVLERCDSRDWNDVPSVSYLSADGSFVSRPRAPRIKDLSVIPSPYVAGTFEPLMAANPHEQWLLLWETNRGCPFSCTFCDWGSATAAKLYTFDEDRLHREIDWCAAKGIEFIFCCDANFGILPRDLEIARYVADTKRRLGYPKALSVQNTKNATERAYAVQKLLADSGLNKGVTLSLQSVDSLTLRAIKRQNISSDSFRELQRRFTRDRVETYTDVILGLPGETYDSFAEGVSNIIADGQHNRIQFNNLSVLPNAEMGDPEYRRQYGMVTVETRVVNFHGSLADFHGEEVPETQELVVATATMPAADWVKTRVFSWTAGFLHFDKVLQIPLILLHQAGSVPYRELLELFCSSRVRQYPTLAEAHAFFEAKARDIQNGGAEYCPSEKWLGIWWPADELLLIELVTGGKLDRFYREAERLLNGFANERGLDLPTGALHDAVALNQALLKRPFQTADLELNLSYNVWSFYQAALRGTPAELEARPCTHWVDRTSQAWHSWEDYCREVIWYGNKKGAYLYGNRTVEREMVGHF